MASLKVEIEQQRPFASAEEEAFLNLLRSSDCLQREFHRQTRGFGVTSTQYNVLRILRGAGEQGLTCAAIGRRMIAAEPDITRLLSRLKKQGLVRQRRDAKDRRVVWTGITEAGLELLRAMDPTIERIPGQMLGHMDPADLAELNRLLVVARSRLSAEPAPECEGSLEDREQ